MKILSHHRSATHHYSLVERFECGIVLLGSEVKALRNHQSSIAESYVLHRDGALFLHNAHIHEYAPSAQFGHEPRRERKLLLRKRQISKIIGQITRKGMTAIPLKIYLNNKNLIKIEIALAVGLKNHDKRQALKTKEWNRQKQRVLKQGANE
jgi:SsrA-binding protein